MKKCAFLTMDSLDDFYSYDTLLVDPLKKIGWNVDFVSWRNQEIDWNQFEAVVIRSPWDYQDDVGAFMEALDKIDASSARLENNLELVKWNINKKYLRDLANKGIPIVPTAWGEAITKDQLYSFFNELDTPELVIKPPVSAGADNTFRISKDTDEKAVKIILETFHDRDFMVQPFMEHIVTEGEFSVFYFGNEYSHTILKTPEPRDFRVQEEHGGKLKSVEAEPALLNSARHVVTAVQPDPLYSRVDFVRTLSGELALMELELIEPSLYFNMDPGSPQRFARVFNEWMS